MDKNLYISYECFKSNPEFGIILKLKNGKEYFYQLMQDSYKFFVPKWKDCQPIAAINKSEIVSFIKIEEYLINENIELPITSPELFKMLTKNYKISEDVNNQVEKDMHTPKKIKI